MFSDSTTSFLLRPRSVSLPKAVDNVTNADPFACLDTHWGGNRDANDIANELHDMRANSRTIETW